ncbi:MAG: sel1 repeat family protein, partial [Alphaproteobacteria bacterium]
QGYAKAQNHIGLRYARGEGVEKDGVKALFWLTLAARQGHSVAETNRKTLLTRLPPDQVERALQMVEAWKPKGS